MLWMRMIFSRVRFSRSSLERTLEFLDPRPDLDLPAPRAAVLLERRPVGLGDGVGVEQAVGRVGRHRPRSAPDAAIDHELGNMDALGRKLAGHRLRQPAQSELAHGEAGRQREALHARGGAGQEDGAMRFGHHALSRLLGHQRRRFTVAWHPFQLNPDMPSEGVDRTQYRISKFFSAERARQLDKRITETAATVGLDFHLERLSRTPNTLNAHRLIRLAGQKGVQDGVVEALFEGYFGNGADIGDDKVLAALGAEGGLDRDDVTAMLSGDSGRTEVLAADRKAHSCGIQGVPSFALQGHVLFSGAVPAAEMAQAF